MTLLPDTENGKFCFIWTIENFSYCPHKPGEALNSPSFKLFEDSGNLFRLELYPRGENQFDYLALYLVLSTSEVVKHDFECALSVRSKSGIFKKVKDETYNIEETSQKYGYCNFIKINELFKKGSDAYLVNNCLTLRCRIWRYTFAACGHKHARTVIGIERIVRHVYFFDFNNCDSKATNSKKIQPSSVETPGFAIHFSLSKGHFPDRKIIIHINQTRTGQENYMTCAISFLEEDNKIVQSAQDEHWFEVSPSTHVWTMQLLPCGKLRNLINLNLDCVFVISKGVLYSEVEYNDDGMANISSIMKRGFQPKPLGILKDDLQAFYTEGKFSDVTICTPSKDFAVHKTILCSRSEVFGAMFEYDTTENRTGIIQIDDLEDETVSKLLLFLYTDVVEDLDFRSASELYFAADKYGIAALKRNCSTFLKDNLSVPNVCDVLILADLHQDEELATRAQDFIQGHADLVMDSDEWKKFMQENVQLAAKTMHLLFLRKPNI